MATIKILLLTHLILFAANGKTPLADDNSYKHHCLNKEEMKLYEMVNQYRQQRRLPPIPLSRSLSYVAKKHVIDLQYNIGKVSHSWSDCKYDSNNPKTYGCMWHKTQELTSYEAHGYECVFGMHPEYATAKKALKSWQRSSGHNNVIVNRGPWRQVEWNALGVAVYKNYAALWFGEIKDSEPSPTLCL